MVLHQGQRKIVTMTQRPAIGVQQFRKTLSRFATGVTVITIAHDEHVHGMTANAFMSVSLNPLLVLISVGHNAQMHKLLGLESRYGVSILSDDQEGLSRHFGGRPVNGLEISFVHEHGVPLLKGAIAHIVAKVVDMHEAGDHTLFIGEVEYLQDHHGNPLLFYSASYGQLTNRHPAELLGWMGL
jgi:flavin reductase (DIM6/NTAB) family NADH-FMN oxidoreductase RutF